MTTAISSELKPSVASGASHSEGRSATTPFLDKSIYFLGIGGCGMSGLARSLTRLGAHCSGSDYVQSDVTDELNAAGINVSLDQSAGFVPETTNLVIASAAIKPDHPEMLAAQSRNIPILTYAEALGMVQSHTTGVSIAGTHGKSTTAALLCHILIESDLDPSFIIGANCPQIGGGSRVGAEKIPFGPRKNSPGMFIAEACEFNRSFHHHRPTIGLINNVEEDHLDIYGSLENVVKAFAQFAELIPSVDDGGYLLIAHDGAHRREITAGLKCNIETLGFNPAADWNVTYDAPIHTVALNRTTPAACDVALSDSSQDADFPVTWTLRMPGDHMALNSAAAAILAHHFGAPWEKITKALSSFRGLDRRMQRLGTRAVQGGEVIIYDDYGHHPTEIDTTLRALRQSENPKRLICVFQPHQHSRTRFLLDQFARSFSSADIVIVPHIYFVRDSEIEKTKVSAQDLVDRLTDLGVTAMHIDQFDAIADHLETICHPGDLVVIMGAGPVWKVGKQLLAGAQTVH